MERVHEVSPQEFSDIRLWAGTLHESEFLTRIYSRWPFLRRVPPYTEIKVVVIWDWAHKGIGPSGYFSRLNHHGFWPGEIWEK